MSFKLPSRLVSRWSASQRRRTGLLPVRSFDLVAGRCSGSRPGLELTEMVDGILCLVTLRGSRDRFCRMVAATVSDRRNWGGFKTYFEAAA